MARKARTDRAPARADRATERFPATGFVPPDPVIQCRDQPCTIESSATLAMNRGQPLRDPVAGSGRQSPRMFTRDQRASDLTLRRCGCHVDEQIAQAAKRVVAQQSPALRRTMLPTPPWPLQPTTCIGFHRDLLFKRRKAVKIGQIALHLGDDSAAAPARASSATSPERWEIVVPVASAPLRRGRAMALN